MIVTVVLLAFHTHTQNKLLMLLCVMLIFTFCVSYGGITASYLVLVGSINVHRILRLLYR